MPERLVIKTASAEDLPALFALYQHLTPDDTPPDPETARAILARFQAYEGSQIFLGETDGQLVASCSLIVIPNLTRGGTPYALIENVVTHTNHRNRGFGQMLLRHATTAAFDAGAYKVMLLTGGTDLAIHAFYRKAGFEQSKTGYQMRRIPTRSPC